MAARSLMFQGTGSDVGKSVLVAGLCRLYARRGLRVRPFKAQNMSNNAAVALRHDGGYGEIGRAQWLQALAAGVEPSTDMNPVLLKPMSETGADIVVQGRSLGPASAGAYQRLKAELLDCVLDSHRRLAQECDLVLVEGAGSASEVNLRDGDIANMGFSRAADVPVVLIGDIDRGGVIASIVGTHCVLPPADRAMIVGTIVNKFRGDPALFQSGLSTITAHTGWPSLGLVPWLSTAGRLPPEDSVALERPRPGGGPRRVRIAVPQPGRIANFDDLDPLAATPGVDVAFVRPGEAIPHCDCILLPGTRATIADLSAFRRNGWDGDIARHHAAGGTVFGICGGFQMLGRRIDDPLGVEGPAGSVEALGLLDVETVMAPDKTVRPARLCAATGEELTGYEIHLGRTTGPDCARPFATGPEGPEGAVGTDGRVAGTYLHGVFGNDAWRRRFLATLGFDGPVLDYKADVNMALGNVADALEAALDADLVLSLAR